jgi:hypothetical protein
MRWPHRTPKRPEDGGRPVSLPTQNLRKDSRFRNQFHHQTFSPSVFLPEKILDNFHGLKLGCRGENTGLRWEDFLANSNLNLGIGAHVPHPVRGLEFCDYVEASIMLCEPDFDLAFTARLSASSLQVKELFQLQITGLSA